MAQLMIRNLEDDIHQKLHDMANRHGESLEEFVHQMLRKAALEYPVAPQRLGTKIAKRFADIGLQQPIAELRGHAITPPGFE